MDREQRPLAYGTDPFSPTPTYPVVYLGRDPLSTEYPGRTHRVELSIQLRLLLPSWCERPPFHGAIQCWCSDAPLGLTPLRQVAFDPCWDKTDLAGGH
jgi:hypothetical protein